MVGKGTVTQSVAILQDRLLTIQEVQQRLSPFELVGERLADRYDPNAIAGFLLSVSIYLASQGPIIADSDTTDGPGNVPWQASAREMGAVPPQRPVLRWMPLDGMPIPDQLQ